jgi:hypothetical protein
MLVSFVWSNIAISYKFSEKPFMFFVPKSDIDLGMSTKGFKLDELFKHISENVRLNYSEHIDEAEKEKSERIEKYILNPRKPRLRYRHLLSVKDAFSDIPINASDETLEARLHEKEFKLEQKREKVFASL